MSRKSIRVRKGGSTTTTKRLYAGPPPSISVSRHPADGRQPHGFRKKGSSFKTGNSHSTITAAELAAAHRGIDNNPEQEEV